MKRKGVVFLASFDLLFIVLSVLLYGSFAPADQVGSLLVTNNSDLVNRDTSSPDTLVANPGPDGISLREDMLAAAGATTSLAISFTPSLRVD